MTKDYESPELAVAKSKVYERAFVRTLLEVPLTRGQARAMDRARIGGSMPVPYSVDPTRTDSVFPYITPAAQKVITLQEKRGK